MKKSILILIVIFITVSNLIAQSAIDPGCIYCKDNEIKFINQIVYLCVRHTY